MKELNPLSGHDESVSKIMEIANGFQKSRILLTACELDLFSRIGDQAMTSEELAAVIGTDKRTLERLLNALCSMELLKKEENYYGNTVATRKCLVHGSPFYLGNLTHLNNLWGSWSNLTECILNGSSAYVEGFEKWEPERVEAFMEAVHWGSAIQAPDVINMINLDGVTCILDLGGGSGAYSVEFAKQLPEARITLYDLPNILPVTKKYLDKSPYGSRIETMPGNYMTDNIGKGYDLVFLSSVLRLNSFWDNVALAKKVYDSLNKGGRIVIQDYIIDSNKCSPQPAVFYSLNMLVNTKSGDTYTETEIWFLLREAWFSDIARKDTVFGTSLVIGVK